MFTFQPINNPHSNGRGLAFRIGNTESDAVTVAFDEYQPGAAGVTLALLRDTGRCEIFETDDGCSIRFVSNEYDVNIVLPISLMSLRTELDMATDDRVKSTGSTGPGVVRPYDDPLGSDIDAPFREDYEPSPYDGTYSED